METATPGHAEPRDQSSAIKVLSHVLRADFKFKM